MIFYRVFGKDIALVLPILTVCALLNRRFHTALLHASGMTGSVALACCDLCLESVFFTILMHFPTFMGPHTTRVGFCGGFY